MTTDIQAAPPPILSPDYIPPIYRLTNEDVLQRIFEICITEQVDIRNMEQNPPARHLFAPWNLSYVCTHWRKVVLSTPVLWSRIFVFARPWKGRLPAMETQLARSGACDLHVFFGPVYANNDIKPRDPKLANLLLPTTSRWVELHIQSIGWLLSLERASFKNLRSLCLRPSDVRGAPRHLKIDAPNLCALEYYGFAKIWIDLPWNCIRFCTLQGAGWKYINSLKAVEELELFTPPLGAHSDTANIVAPFTLPFLHTLTHWDLYHTHVSQLMLTPALTTLRICDPHTFCNVGSVTQLFIRINSNIEEYKYLLQQTPSATTLFIEERFNQDDLVDFWDALALVDGWEVLPALEELRISARASQPLSDQAVLQAIRSRYGVLKRVVVCVDQRFGDIRSVSPSSYPSLRDVCNAGGIEFSTRYKYEVEMFD
ncbi:hypothetical protein CYLTODRAFT_424325 [Cylindrobasidium torrendii FP15055 ss-10]|uniref:Uncharacterized protein n=1 Tax=Cylindrobasidium torrendii FP15055 ss-10 TaxID=1314674 RepID=A0A0D7B5K4_9AGAR|nr:hypothetical protein CYLTODRAFT_424325 [Cylindrobasidium torrendii FP15055 ss-10]